MSATLSNPSDRDFFGRSPAAHAGRATVSEPYEGVSELSDVGIGEAEEAFAGLSLGAIQSVAHRQLVGSTIVACVIAAVAAFAAARSMGPPGRAVITVQQQAPAVGPSDAIATRKR
jgi:hypothetical protein